MNIKKEWLNADYPFKDNLVPIIYHNPATPAIEFLANMHFCNHPDTPPAGGVFAYYIPNKIANLYQIIKRNAIFPAIDERPRNWVRLIDRTEAFAKISYDDYKFIHLNQSVIPIDVQDTIARCISVDQGIFLYTPMNQLSIH